MSCPPVAYPGDQVTFTWTAPSAVGYNLWILPNGTCSDATIKLMQTNYENSCGAQSTTCGPFVARNINPNQGDPCLQSKLTVTVNSNMTSIIKITYGSYNIYRDMKALNTTEIHVKGKNIYGRNIC